MTRTLAAGFLAAGCYSAGDGISPPGDRVYFPVGLALTNEGKYLAVVNSDFDLQYNAGTLQVLEVERLRDFVPQPCEADSDCGGARVCDRPLSESDTGEHSYMCVDNVGDGPCGALGERHPADRLLYPGRCEYLDPAHPPLGRPVQTSHVEIGAFATDAVYQERPATEEAANNGSTGRLFIPVRGDATLHWAEITPEGEVDCGQQFNHGACDGAHRAGDDPDQENSRDLRMDPEPFGVASDALGQAVLVTNQTTGRVSMFRNKWGGDGDLELQFEVTGLPLRPIGVAALPPPAVSSVMNFKPAEREADPNAVQREPYSPGFLVTFRNASEIDLIRYYPDALADPDRPYASRVNAVPITVNSLGVDSRGIAIDDASRVARELQCANDAGVAELSFGCKQSDTACSEQERSYIACLRGVASTSLDVFVANRTPSSLLVGRTTPLENALQSSELPAFYDTISLSQGPSRVVVGNVIDWSAAHEPELQKRVFVSCFDSRRVYVYDPVRRRIDVEIATGRGPHALAVDEAHGLLFVGHFTDSFIGVVSLDRRFSHTYGKTLATVGQPSAPRASK